MTTTIESSSGPATDLAYFCSTATCGIRIHGVGKCLRCDPDKGMLHVGGDDALELGEGHPEPADRHPPVFFCSAPTCGVRIEKLGVCIGCDPIKGVLVVEAAETLVAEPKMVDGFPPTDEGAAAYAKAAADKQAEAELAAEEVARVERVKCDALITRIKNGESYDDGEIAFLTGTEEPKVPTIDEVIAAHYAPDVAEKIVLEMTRLASAWGKANPSKVASTPAASKSSSSKKTGR